mmetsp:Transcript_19548/g.75050  ORF Transcript_19548/g.75050 Transcript_19548/m.75050 type:complete len:209 (+) Transcript_19548:2773-3399(+)
MGRERAAGALFTRAHRRRQAATRHQRFPRAERPCPHSRHPRECGAPLCPRARPHAARQGRHLHQRRRQPCRLHVPRCLRRPLHGGGARRQGIRPRPLQCIRGAGRQVPGASPWRTLGGRRPCRSPEGMGDAAAAAVGARVFRRAGYELRLPQDDGAVLLGGRPAHEDALLAATVLRGAVSLRAAAGAGGGMQGGAGQRPHGSDAGGCR